MSDVMPRATIYCDMDGVLVDFIKGAGEFFGTPWHECITPEQKKARNHCVFESPGMWENLPPCPGMLVLWSYIAPFMPKILTALPRGPDGQGPTENSTKLAKVGKIQWCERYLGLSSDRFHAVLRTDKKLFATKIENDMVVSNILIDDNESNIIEWNRNRGWGILHTSILNTLCQLQAMGISPTQS